MSFEAVFYRFIVPIYVFIASIYLSFRALSSPSVPHKIIYTVAAFAFAALLMLRSGGIL